MKLIASLKSVETQYAQQHTVSLLVKPKAGFVYELAPTVGGSDRSSSVGGVAGSGGGSGGGSGDRVESVDVRTATKAARQLAKARRSSVSTTGAILTRKIAELANEADDGILRPAAARTPASVPASPSMTMAADDDESVPVNLARRLSASGGTTAAAAAAAAARRGSEEQPRSPVLPMSQPPTTTARSASLRAPPNRAPPPVPMAAGAAGQLVADERLQFSRSRSMTADNVFQVFSDGGKLLFIIIIILLFVLLIK